MLDIATSAVTEITTRYDWNHPERYSPEVDKFLRDYVLPKLNLDDYTFDNIATIANYLIKKIKDPMESYLQKGYVMSEEEKKILENTNKAVEEITTRYDYDWCD